MGNLTTANAGSYHIAKILAGRYAPPPVNKSLRLLLAFIILASLFCGYAKADEIGVDKLEHFTVSFALTKGMQWFSTRGLTLKPIDAKIFSAFTVLFVGTLKEYTDREFDSGDMLANVAGVVSASFINLSLDF
jgi:hypothetical protein